MFAQQNQDSPSPGSAPSTVGKRAVLKPLRTSTANAYAKDREYFGKFGGSIPCDVAAIVRYVGIMQKSRLAPATAYRRIAAIGRAHVDAGHPTPTHDPAVRAIVKQLQQGHYPSKNGSPKSAPAKREVRSAKPLTRDILTRIVDALGRNMLDRRDLALLLLGFAGGMKRAALLALNCDDITFTADVMRVRLLPMDGREYASDSKKQPRYLAIAITGGDLCAATAVRRYMEHLAMDVSSASPLFTSYNRAGEPTNKRLNSAYTSQVIRRRMDIVGLNPKGFSAESLARGRRLELAKGML